MILAADHQLHDLVVRFAPGPICRDVASVAKDRALVGELGDLVHSM
jgi:hypothetical protein